MMKNNVPTDPYYQACNESLLLDPTQVQTMLIKASAMKSLGRVNEALEMSECAIEIDPECEEASVMIECLRKR